MLDSRIFCLLHRPLCEGGLHKLDTSAHQCVLAPLAIGFMLKLPDSAGACAAQQALSECAAVSDALGCCWQARESAQLSRHSQSCAFDAMTL